MPPKVDVATSELPASEKHETRINVQVNCLKCGTGMSFLATSLEDPILVALLAMQEEDAKAVRLAGPPPAPIVTDPEPEPLALGDDDDDESNDE
tara:strand:- start:14631 stop:14912 length:282 start_codon:yes stop_codon:yes gene_type:complete